MANITTEFLNGLQSPGEYRDDKLLGFVIKVSDSGIKSYQVQGRIRGLGLVRYTIGKHGSPWTLKQARDEAQRVLYLMKTGVDPRIDGQERKQAQAAKVAQCNAEDLRQSLTIRNVYMAWTADERKTKESTKRLYRQVLYKHLQDWLDIPICDVTPEMVSKRYNAIADQTISSANNCFRALRRLFSWAMLEYEVAPDKPFIPSNPVSVLSKRKKWQSVQSRDDMIADDDLAPWYQAVSNLDSEDFRDYFTFLLVTGLRKREAGSLKWADVKFNRGVFTVRNTKNGRDHTLPMTDFIRDLLEHRAHVKGDSEYVFPYDNFRGHIYDVSHFQGKVIEASKIQFTPHALRRTFSYAAARVRLGDSERKALLNHLASSDVTDAHYTPWQVDDLKEPLALVEEYLLSRAQKQETVAN
jgi:integrase